MSDAAAWSDPTSFDDGRNAALLAWYGEHQRPYPWRFHPTPYRVLVSEVMLQQTQAERVIPHYERFMERFPTMEDLAAASLTDVLEVWTGLGYNSRARRLRDAARQIAAHGWPSDVTALPGIGTYTGAAIRCFAFGDQVPTIDTNLRRVLSRWSGTALSGRALQKTASRMLAWTDEAAVWNQAVMDLGSTMCRPRRPSCDACPVVRWCAGPETYVAPRRQSRFEGSLRQARGAIMRALLDGEADAADLAATTGLEASRLTEALDALVSEGLVLGPPYELAP